MSLYKSLADADKKSTRASQQLEALQKEKDSTGFELVKRNDEIRNLNEKLKLMQAALDRGETSFSFLTDENNKMIINARDSTAEMQYNERLEDIRLLKIEIANIRSHKYLLTRGLCNVIDMRQEVLQLGRDLTQERVRARALEEEMSTPMNIHRWHQLSGRDPEKLDLIFKIQTLQK